MLFPLLGAVAVTVLTVATSSAAPITAAVSTSDAAAASALISQYRASYGLGAVGVDRKLNQAARYQAEAIAGSIQLSHGDFAGRMVQFGIRGQAAENLAAGTAALTETIALWKSSPAHNANLLLSNARRIGLARADAAMAHGRYWVLVIGR